MPRITKVFFQKGWSSDRRPRTRGFSKKNYPNGKMKASPPRRGLKDGKERVKHLAMVGGAKALTNEAGGNLWPRVKEAMTGVFGGDSPKNASPSSQAYLGTEYL